MRTLLLHITVDDLPYLPRMKGILSGRARVLIDNTVPSTAMEIVIKCKNKQCEAVASSSQKLLELVLPGVKSPRLDNYAGSIITYQGIEFLFLDPLKQLMTVHYSTFVFKRFLDKLLHPDQWIVEPSFRWELFQPSRTEELTAFFDSCTLIAVDIETPEGDEERRISCISFTGGKLENGLLTLRTVVVPMDEMYNVLVVRLWVSNSVPKVFQNGKYDIAYLLRYGCPVTSYTFDTINLFHSWLSELPKDLGFISAFMVRKYTFHKNDARGGTLYDLYQYNAKDTYTTLLACLALLTEIPDYARTNFLLEFPLVFPCILSEHTGIKWNKETAARLKKQVEGEMEVELARLRKLISSPFYNPNSPQQTQRLFAILGSKDVTSTDVKGRDKVANRHPLNKIILDRIEDYRKGSKLRGSYFKESIPWLGRCYYALNPHGTDTGRLASRESQFWCGLQVQNITRDADNEEDVSVKEAFEADTGFVFGEADYEQAETRDTAVITGDPKLLEVISDPSKDFHGYNASQFFGLPYEQIVRSIFDQEANEWIHKTLDKPIRDLSKRTNHGANYNMGAQVMLDTMGIAKVLRARELLSLPATWKPIKVTEFLLDRFAKTYPVVRHDYQEWIKTTVANTGLLTGATGWTRRCFGLPKVSKTALNAYVAHNPQSLNAMMLNQAYLKVFYDVYLPNFRDFKLCAQIHDSILFQYRVGREDLAWKVADCMVQTITVRDIFGTSRQLTVPVAVKGNGKTWSSVQSLRRVAAKAEKAAA